MNANDATLAELATTQSGSMVNDDAPNPPADGGFDLIIAAAAGSALGSSGAPYTLTISAIGLTTASPPWPPQVLHQAFDAASGWKPSGTGPDYACTQTIPHTVPGGPGGPLAGHALRFVATLVSPGAQIVAIGRGQPAMPAEPRQMARSAAALRRPSWSVVPVSARHGTFVRHRLDGWCLSCCGCISGQLFLLRQCESQSRPHRPAGRGCRGARP